MGTGKHGGNMGTETWGQETWGKHGDRRDVPRLFPPDSGITKAIPSHRCVRTGSCLLVSFYGSAAACRDRRRSPSCYSAGECATSDSRQRCGSRHLPGAAAGVFATSRSLPAGLLPHVESRAPDRDSANSTSSLASSQTGTWALRGVLECPAVVDRPRMAGAILFLSVGGVASVGSAALCGVESSARRHGGDAGTVEMVERGDALWPDGPRPAAGNGTLAEAMDGCGLAGVHR